MNFLGRSWRAASISSRGQTALIVGTVWLVVLILSLGWSIRGDIPSAGMPVVSIEVGEGLPTLPDLSSFLGKAVIVPGKTGGDAHLRIHAYLDGVEILHRTVPSAEPTPHGMFDGPSRLARAEADTARIRLAVVVGREIGDYVVDTWRRESVASWRIPEWLRTPTRYVIDGVPLPEFAPAPEPSDDAGHRGLLDLIATTAAENGTRIVAGFLSIRAAVGGVGAANLVALSMLFARRQGQYEALLATDVDTRHLILGHLLVLFVGILWAGLLGAGLLFAWPTLGAWTGPVEGAEEWFAMSRHVLGLTLAAAVVATFVMPIVLLAQMKPRRRRTKFLATVATSLIFACLLSLPVAAIHVMENFGFVVGLSCLVMPDGWARAAICDALPFVGWLPISGFAAWVANVSNDAAGAVVSLTLGVLLTIATYRISTRFLRRADMIAED